MRNRIGDDILEIYKLNESSITKIDFKEMKKDKNSKYWIIAAPQELADNNDYFCLYEPTIQECLSPKQHPRLEVYENMSFGVLNIIDRDISKLSVVELNFYLTHTYLIFVIKDKDKLIDIVKKDILDSASNNTGYMVSFSKILYILLDKLTAMDNIILKKIEIRIAALEEEAMESLKRDITKEIIDLRKQLLFLKRYYEPLLDIAEDLEENENNLIDERALKYFAILHNRIQRLNNNVINLRDYVTQVREAYQAQVDINLNKIMKVFTVITAIFLPLTLIAGWYGMNFKYMPELSWAYGYPFVFGLSITVVIISLLLFKKHDFL